ncbi:hypothetical protein [Phenylobacterium sp.]|uniref:hypothetical protein n=1 Tax=Phenylobacterium sp. TaxID=1871053 RepID=UPI00301D41B6
MRLMICALAVSAFSMGAAVAGDAPSAAAKATDAAARTAPARTVYICDSTPETRRGFAREFGRTEFVTARDAVARGQAWAAPKCVTSLEAARLRELAAR